MFLVSRTHTVPFYNTLYDIQQSSAAGNEIVVQENNDDYLDIVERQHQLRLNSLHESLLQYVAILNSQFTELSKLKNVAPGTLETVIQDIKTLTSTIENKRNP